MRERSIYNYTHKDPRIDKRTLLFRRTLIQGDIIVKRRWFPGRNSEFGVYLVDMNERDHIVRRGSFLEYLDAMFFANILLNKEEKDGS